MGGFSAKIFQIHSKTIPERRSSMSKACAVEAVTVPSCPNCGTRPAYYGRHQIVESGDRPAAAGDRVELIWNCDECDRRVVLTASIPEPLAEPQAA
jgi:hypothetical protein